MATGIERASIGHAGPSPTSHGALTYPLGDRAPEPGELLSVMPGIRWWRVPVPGPLRHVNGVILDDADGATIVDTGTIAETSIAAWRAMIAGPLAGQRVARVLCTHYHPDHVGLAGWLCRKFAAPLTMTRTEWLLLRMIVADAGGAGDGVPEEQIAYWQAAGWNDDQLSHGRSTGWGRFAQMVSRLPMSFERIRDGDVLRIGGADWHVVVGSGHSPEHACLVDHDRKVMIAGDQVLPRISSNVSLMLSEPGGDPLGDWLASIARFKTLPADLLVLPGHGEPFHGLHARLDALDREHRERLDAIVALMRGRRVRAVDCFAVLFARPIGTDVLGMATGEAMAHLRRLEVEGRAVRRVEDGVWWYASA